MVRIKFVSIVCGLCIHHLNYHKRSCELGIPINPILQMRTLGHEVVMEEVAQLVNSRTRT